MTILADLFNFTFSSEYHLLVEIPVWYGFPVQLINTPKERRSNLIYSVWCAWIIERKMN